MGAAGRGYGFPFSHAKATFPEVLFTSGRRRLRQHSTNLKTHRPSISITVLLAVVLLGSGAASELRAQGQFIWGNHFLGVHAPIYGPDPVNPIQIKRGNTATGIPAGTQTYAGPLLEGTGYTVGIYVGRTALDVEAQMEHVQTTTFRTGAGAGVTYPLEAAAPFIPPGTPNVNYQFRVWGNLGGALTSWAQVMAAGGNIGGVGVSEVYVFTTPLGGGNLTPPVTLGIRSFQLIGFTPVPEPSSWALLALGALSAASFGLHRRHRK